MNILSINFFKSLRKLYSVLGLATNSTPFECDQNAESVSQKITNSLLSPEPCMIGRLGANELAVVVNYLGVKKKPIKLITFLKGQNPPWWWEKSQFQLLYNVAGFFPIKIEYIEKFCDLMINDIPEVDVLGSWLVGEKHFEKELQNCSKVGFELLNPYFSKIPWTKALEGKKVLVVHPFAKTIERQYLKRNLLFSENLLPAFDLKTITAVSSLAGETTPFKDWFDALEYLKAEIDKQDYDICLIGCGAYGFPLAAHVKRMGKKGFHLGGSLQLLFGIKGKRWENESYNAVFNYARLMNEHWVRPSEDEKPEKAEKVEGATYW